MGEGAGGERRGGEEVLTCHETMYMEKGHDYQRFVLWPKLISGNDVGETGGQVALVQWHSLHRPKRNTSDLNVLKSCQLPCQLSNSKGGYHLIYTVPTPIW